MQLKSRLYKQCTQVSQFYRTRYFDNVNQPRCLMACTGSVVAENHYIRQANFRILAPFNMHTQNTLYCIAFEPFTTSRCRFRNAE